LAFFSSVLGHLKFWKKKPVGIEFAKHFRSHLSPIEGLAVSAHILQFILLIQGCYCATYLMMMHRVFFGLHAHAIAPTCVIGSMNDRKL
jgi:hypothetical protein